MIAVVIVLLIVLLAVLIVSVFDFIPIITDIIKRRGIGSFSSADEWLKKAEEICEIWLEKGVPVVPQNAEKKHAIAEIVKGSRRVESIQHWQEASVLLAVNKFDSEKAADFIKLKLSDDGLFNTDRVDVAMLAYAMLENGCIDRQEIKPYMDKAVKILLDKYERTGRIPYGGNDNICFVDTIGLVCPFLAKYSVEYGDDRALLAAMKIINDYSENGIHNALGLPVHCYDSENGAPLGIYGWGRGCGWWAVGLTDTFDVLDRAGGYEKEKTVLLKAMTAFADVILKYQCSNGAFDRNVLHFSGEDSSATAMLSFFLAYTGKIAKKDLYIKAASEAMKYIYSVTRKDGTVDYSQGDTMGVGFYSTASIVVPAAQGFALRAYLMIKGEYD